MRIIKSFITLVWLSSLAMAAQADSDVIGLWQTEPGDTGGYLVVEISACDDKICGVIKEAYKEGGAVSEGYEHLGKNIIWDMQATTANHWASGKIWAPDRDKTYKSKMKLDGDTLKVSGCVMGGLICRSQAWKRP